MPESSLPKQSGGLTESAWFWLAVFCLMGAVALWAAGPKYARRQPQLERQFLARQVGGQSVMGHDGPAQPKWGGPLLIPLQPVQWTLITVGSLALVALIVRHRQSARGDRARTAGSNRS